MSAEEMRRRKKELGLTNQELAERSGVLLSTVAKVLGGTTAKPGKDTVRALEAVLLETVPQERIPREPGETEKMYPPPSDPDGKRQDESPVYISDGKCVVEFSRIRGELPERP